MGYADDHSLSQTIPDKLIDQTAVASNLNDNLAALATSLRPNLAN